MQASGSVTMEKKVHEPSVDAFPENPPWTMFFDGPLYQRYDELMRGKDFSKILLSSKLRLANKHVDTGSEPTSKDPGSDFWDFNQDPETQQSKYSPERYQTETGSYQGQYAVDEKRRTRRTRACIWITIVIMAALAFGTAMVIHYFIIPAGDGPPANNMNISLSSGNTTISPVTTTQTVINTTTDEELARMLDRLNRFGDTSHVTRAPVLDVTSAVTWPSESNVSSTSESVETTLDIRSESTTSTMAITNSSTNITDPTSTSATVNLVPKEGTTDTLVSTVGLPSHLIINTTTPSDVDLTMQTVQPLDKGSSGDTSIKPLVTKKTGGLFPDATISPTAKKVLTTSKTPLGSIQSTASTETLSVTTVSTESSLRASSETTQETSSQTTTKSMDSTITDRQTNDEVTTSIPVEQLNSTDNFLTTDSTVIPLAYLTTAAFKAVTSEKMLTPTANKNGLITTPASSHPNTSDLNYIYEYDYIYETTTMSSGGQ